MALAIALLVAATPARPAHAADGAMVSSLRFNSGPAYTRIVIDLSEAADFAFNRIKSPERFYVDIHGTKLMPTAVRTLEVGDRYISVIRASQNDSETVRVVMDLASDIEYKVFRLSTPSRIVVDIYGPGGHSDEGLAMASVKDGLGPASAVTAPAQPQASDAVWKAAEAVRIRAAERARAEEDARERVAQIKRRIELERSASAPAAAPETAQASAAHDTATRATGPVPPTAGGRDGISVSLSFDQWKEQHTESKTLALERASARAATLDRNKTLSDAIEAAAENEQKRLEEQRLLDRYEKRKSDFMAEQERVEQERRRAEELAQARAAEEVRRKSDAEARQKAEEEAMLRAEQQRRKSEEMARLKADEEARRQAEEDARREAEDRARRLAELKRQQQAVELAKKQADSIAAKSTMTGRMMEKKQAQTAQRSSGETRTKEEGRDQFRLRRVVVDAGHGGKDPGAIGPGGLQEKEVVLDIAKRVKAELEKTGKYEVILTRASDKYLDLEERTVIANQKDADLFVSIHANANTNKTLGGMETYLLNWTDDEEAMKVAARENMISVKRMQESRNDVGVMLASLALQDKRDKSLALANYVQGSMYTNVSKQYDGVRDHGVKQAMFYVLFGAQMPSVLVEVSYITNKQEASRLKSKTYKTQLAAGIAGGVETYFENSSQIQQMASR